VQNGRPPVVAPGGQVGERDVSHAAEERRSQTKRQIALAKTLRKLRGEIRVRKRG